MRVTVSERDVDDGDGNILAPEKQAKLLRALEALMIIIALFVPTHFFGGLAERWSCFQPEYFHSLEYNPDSFMASSKKERIHTPKYLRAWRVYRRPQPRRRSCPRLRKNLRSGRLVERHLTQRIVEVIRPHRWK